MFISAYKNRTLILYGKACWKVWTFWVPIALHLRSLFCLSLFLIKRHRWFFWRWNARLTYRMLIMVQLFLKWVIFFKPYVKHLPKWGESFRLCRTLLNLMPYVEVVLWSRYVKGLCNYDLMVCRLPVVSLISVPIQDILFLR